MSFLPLTSQRMSFTTLFYITTTILSGLLTSTCMAHNPVYYSLSLISRPHLSLVSSLITEYAVFFLFAKLFLVYELSRGSLINGWIMEYTYRLDLAIMLILWGLFLQCVFARHPIYEATKFMRNRGSTVPPSVLSWSFWFRFSNPFWTSRALLIHSSLPYLTKAEIETAQIALRKNDSVKAAKITSTQDNCLDVFQHPSFPRNCPVIIYIHGGQWRTGDKTERPPLLSFLALKRYVVVSVNFRLDSSLQDQLVDVKRAIRWVRQNIAKFGGDAGFIAIVGAGSGAHLAVMTAMTPNDPVYQPGFETIDTSVNAVCSLAGYYDLTRNWGYGFSKWVEREMQCEAETSRAFSPLWRLKEAEANKSRVEATELEKRGLELVPFLVIHGTGDCLSPYNSVYEFTKEFQETTYKPRLTFVTLVGCGHEFPAWSSIRSHSVGYGIEPFMRFHYEEYLESIKKV